MIILRDIFCLPVSCVDLLEIDEVVFVLVPSSVDLLSVVTAIHQKYNIIYNSIFNRNYRLETNVFISCYVLLPLPVVVVIMGSFVIFVVLLATISVLVVVVSIDVVSGIVGLFDIVVLSSDNVFVVVDFDIGFPVEIVFVAKVLVVVLPFVVEV